MINYSEIKKPLKIITLTDNFEIFYIDDQNDVMIFDAKKIQNLHYKELVLTNFEKVEIESGGFVWNFEQDDAFFGKDTILDYSKEASIDDLFLILKKSENLRNKISEKKIKQILVSLF